MAIYDKASLVLIPSGTKTSKVYSQKPTNGDGDFTFSRSTAATRVNASGNIEKETQNLITQSNNFSHSDWINSGITLTSGQAGPFGSNNAWRYLMTGGIGSSYSYQNNRTINGSPMVLSFWVKSNTGSNQTFRATANSGAQASPVFTATTEWQRFSWFFVSSAGGSNILLAYNPTTNVDLVIYGAQFEQGLVARDYIETTTTAIYGGITDNVPRLDYTDSSCPALLLEPQRTNLFDNSEYIEGWSTSNTGATIEENATTSPEGVVNAAKIKEDGNNAAHAIRNLTGPTLTSGTDYTFSFFAKKGERSIVALSNTIGASNDANCFFDLENGQVLTNQFNSASIEDFGNGWYRCIATDTADAADDYDTRIYTATADNQFSHQGVSGNGLYIYGLQLEAGSYATSYIPTYGSAVTRNGESNAVTGVSSLIGQTQGTLFLEAEAQSGFRTFSICDGSTSNRITIAHNVPASFVTIPVYGGVVGTQLSTSYTSGNIKIAVTYSGGNYSMFVNGTKINSASIGTFSSTLNKIEFAQGNGGNPFAGDAKQALVFPTALTDQEAIDLTTL